MAKEKLTPEERARLAKLFTKQPGVEVDVTEDGDLTITKNGHLLLRAHDAKIAEGQP